MRMVTATFVTNLDDWWPCACVKGGNAKRGKPSTHIKLHPPTTQECRVCGVTKAQHDDAVAGKG